MKPTRREVATVNPRRKPRNSSSQAVKSRLTVSLIGSRPLFSCLSFSLDTCHKIDIGSDISSNTRWLVAFATQNVLVRLYFIWWKLILTSKMVYCYSFASFFPHLVAILHVLYSKLNNNWKFGSEKRWKYSREINVPRIKRSQESSDQTKRVRFFFIYICERENEYQELRVATVKSLFSNIKR